MDEAGWSVPLSDVLVDDELVEAAASAVRSGWWSMGPRVGEFEQAFAEFSGARHAVAVANGSAALHLALLACGCGPGDEVVLPSLNFVAAANSIAHTGAMPVFCDIRGADDLNLDPDDLESAVTPRTKALLVLHYGGHPCDMARVLEIAQARGLTVIEDAAHAPGASWRGRACGTLGDIGCFSFFSNKNLAIGEGGVIVTDDDELADRVRLLRSHGMTTLTWDRHRGHAHTYDVVAQGFNYRLDELRAAIGLVQLRRLPAGNLARAALVARYRSLLHGLEGATMPFDDGSESSSAHHLAVAILPPGAPRDAVREALRANRVQTSVHYPPIHGFSQYREAGSSRPLPRTEDVAERLITLPLFPHMTEDQVDLVAAELVGALSAWGGANGSPKSRLGEAHEAEGVQAGLAASTRENLPE
jgi:dTDP-4-amino-4,6-dideoxygalactose transaminase